MNQRTVLVVDDQKDRIQALSALLRFAPERYAVLTAINGKEACEVASRDLPDLILMDWMMPEMDGLTALQHIKANPETKQIPVLMLTALDSPKRLEEALAAGAVDYLRMPVEKIELLARARAAVALAESYKKIVAQSRDLETQNAEIARQQELLERQAEEIRQANVQLQHVNQALEAKNAQLTEVNYEKNELLGIVAHDLKNPLSNIKMLARALLNEAQTPKQERVQEYSQDISSDVEKMFELVTKLLDISAIERNGFKFELREFDFGVAAQTVTEHYHSRAMAKQISLEFQAPSADIRILSDYSAITQILDNLVSNALKYSPLGSTVFVRASRRAESDGAWLARCEVQDQGPGLSENDKTKLFGKFARLSAKPTGGEHSTGLGLSIVKKIVEALGGRVWCESEVGAGATFVVEIPSAPPSAPGRAIVRSIPS